MSPRGPRARLQALREGKGLSRRALSDALGWPPRIFVRLEDGTQDLSLDDALVLSVYFKCDVKELAR